jgi:hypothetical protein
MDRTSKKIFDCCQICMTILTLLLAGAFFATFVAPIRVNLSTLEDIPGQLQKNSCARSTLTESSIAFQETSVLVFNGRI